MVAGIVPILSERDWRTNRLCCYILIRATIVFLLVAASIGCYFAASRTSNQYGTYNDFNVDNVTYSSEIGKLFNCYPLCSQNNIDLINIGLQILMICASNS